MFLVNLTLSLDNLILHFFISSSYFSSTFGLISFFSLLYSLDS